tara:strand:- start:1047 stop:1280 length:234 start_codon:yes stop_codon:yes gene_type:complete
VKKPFLNKNKPIRIKGPRPNTKSTIFAVLGVVFFSSTSFRILGVDFFLDFLLGIPENKLKGHNSSNLLRKAILIKVI